MIDNVRSTVLAVLNKENRGYITPAEFNLFAKQAQLEIFERTFEEYTNWVTKSLVRRSHTEYADMPKILREKIDVFSTYDDMIYDNVKSLFTLPDDGYRLSTVVYNNTEIEEVFKSQLPYLYMSDMTAPSVTFPMYIRLGNSIEVHPTSISSSVKAYYIRKPKDPKWTYITWDNNPMFDGFAQDYQDFELHPSEESNLVIKILEYAGLSIREAEVNQILQSKENIESQTVNR